MVRTVEEYFWIVPDLYKNNEISSNRTDRLKYAQIYQNFDGNEKYTKIYGIFNLRYKKMYDRDRRNRRR